MSCCVERKITQANQFLIMSCCVERKITQAYHNIMERICDDVNYILNKLIEKGTFLYTIKDDMDSESQSNPLAKSDFLIRRILNKNAGHDFLDVLNERGRYGDILQKIWNQDKSREGTFRCERCEVCPLAHYYLTHKRMAPKIEDQIVEMQADFERRLQQYQEEYEKRLQKYQEESEKRRQQDQEEFKKKRKQDREEMLKIIKTHRMDVKRKANKQTLKGKRKIAKRQWSESRRLEISSLEAEIASLRKRIEELERTVLKRENVTNDLKVEKYQETTLTTKTLPTMQLIILLCAF